MTDQYLLPYEWPGSYFIDEEVIEAVNQVLLARSPHRFYGHDLQHTTDQLEALINWKRCFASGSVANMPCWSTAAPGRSRQP